ncbi:MAG: hypothetical protein R3D55_14315 [Chloroflexota bacterium]
MWLRILFIIIATQCYVSLWLSMKQSSTNSQREPSHMANDIWNLVLLFTAVLPSPIPRPLGHYPRLHPAAPHRRLAGREIVPLEKP